MCRPLQWLAQQRSHGLDSMGFSEGPVDALAAGELLAADALAAGELLAAGAADVLKPGSLISRVLPMRSCDWASSGIPIKVPKPGSLTSMNLGLNCHTEQPVPSSGCLMHME